MAEQHIGEPAPECSSLRCQKCNRLRHAECHTIGDHDEDGVLIDGHDFQPGPCNCIVGKLRARVQELERQKELLGKETRKWQDKFNVVKEWQRRAVPQVRRAKDAYQEELDEERWNAESTNDEVRRDIDKCNRLLSEAKPED